eukprot:9492259-Pyramimonas_sp.AAC.1
MEEEEEEEEGAKAMFAGWASTLDDRSLQHLFALRRRMKSSYAMRRLHNRKQLSVIKKVQMSTTVAYGGAPAPEGESRSGATASPAHAEPLRGVSRFFRGAGRRSKEGVQTFERSPCHREARASRLALLQQSMRRFLSHWRQHGGRRVCLGRGAPRR